MVGSEQMGDKMETECIELKRGREGCGLVGGDVIIAPSWFLKESATISLHLYCCLRSAAVKKSIESLM